MKVISLLVMAVCALTAVPCLAGDDRDDDHRYGYDHRRDARDVDEDWDFDRPRLYIGLGPLWAMENFDDHRATVRTGGGALTSVEATDADDTWGADARVGYRVHPHLAIEGQGQYYGDFHLRGVVPGATSASDVAKLEGLSFTTNVKIFPITGRVQPYFLLGGGFLWARFHDAARSTESLTFAGRGGVGADFYIDENFAVNIEGTYLAPTDELQDFRLAGITGGIQFHF